jgi:glutathione S-transferase
VSASERTSTGAGLPVLWQITFSHYNEKARWALDYKGIAHRRHSLAPGTHARHAKRLWGGRTTPFLELDGHFIGDTTEIIAELERLRPEPALYPADDAQRRRALELEEHFDTELGPYIRGAVFDAMLPRRDALVPISAQQLGIGTRVANHLIYPVSKRVIRKQLVDAIGGPQVCRTKTVNALDRLEAELEGRDYLVGDRFTVADLTAAALFSPLVAPAEFPYQLFEDRRTDDWQRFRDSLSERPGYRWVEETYRRHRGRSAEVEAIGDGA